ncbi:hypothetical protein [Actinomyces procaprae]|uniref:hypothetical protein n=1 Tax=Actinomyces procaprae TaxID=2560010 RepID=UPI0010A25843|nr:hypothetical protein [Actinomyces procaprae]
MTPLTRRRIRHLRATPPPGHATIPIQLITDLAAHLDAMDHAYDTRDNSLYLINRARTLNTAHNIVTAAQERTR